jgi:hypothetical protein
MSKLEVTNHSEQALVQLFNENYGPIVNILRFLNKEDIRKLAFVCSSNINQMVCRYKTYKSLSSLGRKIETSIFETKKISFHPKISVIKQFMKEISTPLNNLTSEQYKFLDGIGFIKNKEYNFTQATKDLHILHSAVSIGEKIDQDILTTYALMQKYRFQSLVVEMVKSYNDPLFVRSMLPLKAVALIICQDVHYLIVLRVFKFFGISYIKELIEMLDQPIYFKRLFKSFEIYTERGESLIRDYEIFNTRYKIKHLTSIVNEGRMIIQFVDSIIENFPVVNTEEFKTQEIKKSLIDSVDNVQNLIVKYHGLENE